jgi:hypothetical protein
MLVVGNFSQHHKIWSWWSTPSGTKRNPRIEARSTFLEEIHRGFFGARIVWLEKYGAKLVF